MKQLILTISILFVAAASQASNVSSRDLESLLSESLSFKNGYSETIGLRNQNADHTCGAFISLEVPGTIRVGIADGDFHAGYTLTNNSLVNLRPEAQSFTIQDQDRNLTIHVSYANHQIAIRWFERYWDFGFIPRSTKVTCGR